MFVKRENKERVSKDECALCTCMFEKREREGEQYLRNRKSNRTEQKASCFIGPVVIRASPGHQLTWCKPQAGFDFSGLDLLGGWRRGWGGGIMSKYCAKTISIARQ